MMVMIKDLILLIEILQADLRQQLMLQSISILVLQTVLLIRVVSIYDEDAGLLKMRYSSAAVTGDNPTTNVAWTNSTVVFPEDVGNYVSMVIDSDDGIHMAAFDSDADLVYMYMLSYSSGQESLVTIRADQAFSVGNWTKIKVKEDVGSKIPYIAYYNSSETGSRDSIKIAYANYSVDHADFDTILMETVMSLVRGVYDGSSNNTSSRRGFKVQTS